MTESKSHTKKTWKGRWLGLIIAASVIVIILVIGAVGYHQVYIAPYQRTIITVDNTSIDTGYFIKRMKLSETDAVNMLGQLTNELIIRNAAPGYGIKVTSEEVTQQLREIAKSGRTASTQISEQEYQEWYRQQLNESGLSDTEYQEIIRTGLTVFRFQQYFSDRVPKTAEQIHLYGIVTQKAEEAQRIRDKWKAGEDFYKLARETSIDEETRKKNGDLGWFPRGVMGPEFDEIIFKIALNNVSDPIPFSQGSSDPSQPGITLYTLLYVAEKADARVIEDSYLQILQANALDRWLFEEINKHQVTSNLNSEMNTWLNSQLSK